MDARSGRIAMAGGPSPDVTERLNLSATVLMAADHSSDAEPAQGRRDIEDSLYTHRLVNINRPTAKP
jgi:hypothetical protein